VSNVRERINSNMYVSMRRRKASRANILALKIVNAAVAQSELHGVSQFAVEAQSNNRYDNSACPKCMKKPVGRSAMCGQQRETNSVERGRTRMKTSASHLLAATAATLLLGSAVFPAFAEDRPAPIAPPKTMGDEGKLPPTGTVGGAVPEMGATAPVEIGPSKRMGDEGKLPATKAMGGATPPMTAPAAPPAAPKE
jgi:hypothetical protein